MLLDEIGFSGNGVHIGKYVELADEHGQAEDEHRQCKRQGTPHKKAADLSDAAGDPVMLSGTSAAELTGGHGAEDHLCERQPDSEHADPYSSTGNEGTLCTLGRGFELVEQLVEVHMVILLQQPDGQEQQDIAEQQEHGGDGENSPSSFSFF